MGEEGEGTWGRAPQRESWSWALCAEGVIFFLETRLPGEDCNRRFASFPGASFQGHGLHSGSAAPSAQLALMWVTAPLVWLCGSSAWS